MALESAEREAFSQVNRGAVKYGSLKWMADRRIARVNVDDSVASPVQSAYLIGCGRSGTTVCGDVLRHHPRVRYFFEPYHLWATIDPTIDVLNLYHIGASSFLLDGGRCTRNRNDDSIGCCWIRRRRSGAAVMLEKTPFNACRIGYLDAISPHCKFIHLVRDGVDVARSIDRLSRDRGYGIVGKPDLNRWWGRAGSKWTALYTDGCVSNYFADELPQLLSYESKGAYEWLVSLGEVDRWRSRLGDRLLEITYDELTARPEDAVKRICEFLSLGANNEWMHRNLGRIDQARQIPVRRWFFRRRWPRRSICCKSGSTFPTAPSRRATAIQRPGASGDRFQRAHALSPARVAATDRRTEGR